MNVHFTHRKRINSDGSYTFQLRTVTPEGERAKVLFRAFINTKRLKKRADKELQRRLAKIRNEWAYNPISTNSLHIEDAVKRYSDYAHGKDSTRAPMLYQQARDHDRIVAEFVETLPRRITLNKITRGMFNRYFDSLVERHKPQTVSQYCVFLQAFFTYAYNSEWMNRRVDCFTKDQHRSLHVLKPEKFISDESLAQAFALEDYGLLCRTLAETGLRISEAAALTCSSFSTVEHTIRVESSQEERTKRHARVVPISEELANELAEYAGGKLHYEPLFEFAQTTLRDNLKPLGLKPHDLRRFFNSALVEALTPDLFRKKLMGHTLGATDGAYLINFDPEQAAPFTAKVNEKIEAIRNTKGNNDGSE